MQRDPITTHVLDTALGRPVQGMRITLEQDATTCIEQRSSGLDFAWVQVGETMTNADGRGPGLSTSLMGKLVPGVYRATFFTQEYFEAQGTATFYPKVEITFRIVDVDQHFHIPLLLSPFGFSTYRGS